MNCSQIFCTFAVETTASVMKSFQRGLWIALKFFVLLQSKQQRCIFASLINSCELLSNFLYFCSRNNRSLWRKLELSVVNCSQIFCTFAVETTWIGYITVLPLLWIALKFFVLLQSKQRYYLYCDNIPSCELLSNFLYFCSRNNHVKYIAIATRVVNCSQIFCTFAVETTSATIPVALTQLWIALKFFVLLQSKQL